MTSPVTGVGILMVVLGILVAMFRPRSGLKLGAVGVVLVILGSLNPTTDLLPIVAVTVVAVGLLAVTKSRTLGLLVVLLGVCVAIAWSLGVASPPESAAAPPSDPVDDCRAVAFVGLRGSGELRDAHLGYGDVIGQVRDAVHDSVIGKGLTFADMPVDYPALAVAGGADWSLAKDLTFMAAGGRSLFLDGANVGAELLSSRIKLISTVCGSRTRVVVAGYSQGAMAAHDGLSTLTKAQLNRVVSVDLIADPLRPAGQTDALTGHAPTGKGVGVAVGLFPPTIASQAVRSWCLQGDPVCTYAGHPKALLNLDVHIKGYQAAGVPARAAKLAAANALR